MGALKFTLTAVLVLLAAFIVHLVLREHPPPVEPEWKNFGQLSDKEALAADKLPPQNFKVVVTDEEIDDYKRRLNEARLPPAMSAEVNMTYGYPSHALPQLREKMLEFDMRQWETLLNTYKHYKLSILGLQMHYIKVTADTKLKKVPLLLIHGWPGSFYEFYKAIPMLQKKAEKQGFSYEFIIPSLPGYGYSEPPAKPGCSPRYVAVILNQLMARLGYDRYISQGGDWGAFVTEWIVGLYPDRVIGFHSNMFSPPALDENPLLTPYTLIAWAFPSLVMEDTEALIAKDKGLLSGITFLLSEGGYFHLQGTKPDSLGPGLTDSPLGLAVYILEKFYTWTHASLVNKPIQQATAELPFSIDEALVDVLIYWHSNTILSSARLYKEAFSDLDHRPFYKTSVPAAVLMTAQELSFCPKFIARLRADNLMQYTALWKGGHFAAFEIPEEFSSDVVSFTKGLLDPATGM